MELKSKRTKKLSKTDPGGNKRVSRGRNLIQALLLILMLLLDRRGPDQPASLAKAANCFDGVAEFPIIVGDNDQSVVEVIDMDANSQYVVVLMRSSGTTLWNGITKNKNFIVSCFNAQTGAWVWTSQPSVSGGINDPTTTQLKIADSAYSGIPVVVLYFKKYDADPQYMVRQAYNLATGASADNWWDGWSSP